MFYLYVCRYWFTYVFISKISVVVAYTWSSTGCWSRLFLLWLSDLSSSSSSMLSPSLTETPLVGPPWFNGPCGEPECVTITFNKSPYCSCVNHELLDTAADELGSFCMWSLYFWKLHNFWSKCSYEFKMSSLVDAYQTRVNSRKRI